MPSKVGDLGAFGGNPFCGHPWRYRPEGPETRPEGPEMKDFRPEGPETRPEGPDFRPEGPEMKDFRPEGPEIRPEGPEMWLSRFLGRFKHVGFEARRGF